MVRIRLRRMGAKKKPFYRVVVADKRSPRDGRFIEAIGSYDPLTEPATVNLQADRAAYWLSVGAQPSDSVSRILKSMGLLDEAGKPLPIVEADEAVNGVAIDGDAEGTETDDSTSSDTVQDEPVAATEATAEDSSDTE